MATKKVLKKAVKAAKKTVKKAVTKAKKAVGRTPAPLTAKEIKRIHVLNKKGLSQRAIAQDIKRSRSAVFYQLQKGPQS